GDWSADVCSSDLGASPTRASFLHRYFNAAGQFSTTFNGGAAVPFSVGIPASSRFPSAVPSPNTAPTFSLSNGRGVPDSNAEPGNTSTTITLDCETSGRARTNVNSLPFASQRGAAPPSLE